MCLAQEHKEVMLVRLEPAALRSQVKNSTTELPGDVVEGYSLSIALAALLFGGAGAEAFVQFW